MTSFYSRLPVPEFHTVATGADGWASNVMDNMNWIWPNRPVARYFKSTSTSCSDATTKTPTFNVERWSNYMYLSGSDAVVSVPGLYLISLHADWEANTTGLRKIGLAYNGSVTWDVARPGSSGYCTQTLTTVAYLNGDGTIGIRYWQDSGGTLKVNAGSTGQYDKQDLAITWIGETHV